MAQSVRFRAYCSAHGTDLTIKNPTMYVAGSARGKTMLAESEEEWTVGSGPAHKTSERPVSRDRLDELADSVLGQTVVAEHKVRVYEIRLDVDDWDCTTDEEGYCQNFWEFGVMP